MKARSKQKPKRKIFVFLAIIFLILLVCYLKANKVTGLTGQENYYFFSKQALLNGINTSRGYGTEVGLGSGIAKLLFNKTFFPIMYFFELARWFFNLLISLVMFLIN